MVGGEFVRFSRDRRAEPQHFAGLGDLEDQGLTIRRADGELHAPLAQHKNAAGRLPFDE